jgi:glycosyltransferase involved in cell wall biosynthesis
MNNQRLKIIVVTEFFYPAQKAGGGLCSLLNLLSQTQDEYEYLILTSDRDVDQEILDVETNIPQNLPYGKVVYLSKKNAAERVVEETIRNESPDVILCNSFFSALCRKVLWARYRGMIHQTPVILFPHGELFPIPLKVKRFRKKAYLFIVRNMLKIYQDVWFCSCGEKETEHTKRWFPDGKVKVIPEAFVKLKQPICSLVREPKIPGHAKMIFVGRILLIKNIDFALECLREIKGNVEFLIYGPIEDEDYWKKCQKVIERLPGNIKVVYGGVLTREEVLYQFYDSHFMFFPTLSENYGHVILESLSMGTPVIISERTPWASVEQAGAGWVCSLAARQNLIEVLNHCVAMGEDQYQKHRDAAKQYADESIRGHVGLSAWKDFLRDIHVHSDSNHSSALQNAAHPSFLGMLLDLSLSAWIVIVGLVTLILLQWPYLNNIIYKNEYVYRIARYLWKILGGGQ